MYGFRDTKVFIKISIIQKNVLKIFCYKLIFLSLDFIILKKEYKIKVCKFIHKNSYSLKFTLIMDFKSNLIISILIYF
jgi:hypothetical protein